MTSVMAMSLALVLCAAVEVPAGTNVAAAIARSRPGDVVQLGPGEHRGSLGRLSGIRIAGAGAGVTFVVAAPGDDGVVALGDVALEGLTIRAGPMRCALKVLGGHARLDGVALVGGSCGAFVSDGRLDGRDVELRGEHALLVERGKVELDGGSAKGAEAGVAMLGGEVVLRRFDVVGPSDEAGIAVAGGVARLEGVVVRAPGPTGISVSAGGRVEGRDVTVAGTSERDGYLGDCVQAIRSTVRLEGATLARCGGAAVEVSGGEIALTATDSSGGSAGCIVLVNGARADLVGNLCAGRGPGLVVASASRARTRAGRWWTDPVLWVDCASGARVEVGRGDAPALRALTANGPSTRTPPRDSLAASDACLVGARPPAGGNAEEGRQPCR